MVDLAPVEGFVDVVAGGDEEEGGEDEGEGGEGCGVEDAEEGDVGVGSGEMHGKDMGVAGMVGMMVLGSKVGAQLLARRERLRVAFGSRG